MSSEDRGESDTRNRILDVAWELIATRRAADVTMADVAKAAATSRQTVYVQFGSRARLLVEMVQHRDAVNPERDEIIQSKQIDQPVAALEALVVVLAHRWRAIHPVAQALHAAAISDEDARAAWQDRMLTVLRMARRVTDLLAERDMLPGEWSSETAADWLWSTIHPMTWVHLVVERGWSQQQYERRLVALTRAVLVHAPP